MIQFHSTTFVFGNSNIIREHCHRNEHKNHIKYACNLYEEEVRMSNGCLANDSHFSSYMLKEVDETEWNSGYMKNLTLLMQDVNKALNLQHLYLVFPSVKGKNF